MQLPTHISVRIEVAKILSTDPNYGKARRLRPNSDFDTDPQYHCPVSQPRVVTPPPPPARSVTLNG